MQQKQELKMATIQSWNTKNAINSANLKAQEVKEKFNSKKNALIRSILERRMEIQKKKATKALNKLSQLEKFSSKFAI